MEQQTGSKLRKEYDKAVFVTLFIYMQSTSCEILGWMKHKLESRLPGEISIGKLVKLWTARRSNQSILKEISPKYSLKALMMKLKLQYFGHLIRRADLLKKDPDAGKD